MAKNMVKNAKTAARKFLAGVVNGVKAKADKGKTADVPTPVKPAAPKAKDATVKPAAPKAKGKKKADLSVPRNAVGKAVRKGLNKHVDADSVTTATNTLGRGSNRAKVFDMSASSVWRALGFRKDKNGDYVYTVSDCKAFRDGLGLDGVITDTNVKCQFGDGRGRGNGNDPLYGGEVAQLDAKQWKVVDDMVKAARSDD